MVTRRQISRYKIYMTSGWACTSEDLVVDLQVDLQNDATFIQTVSFGLLRLDCFLPSLNPSQLLSSRLSVQTCRISSFTR